MSPLLVRRFRLILATFLSLVVFTITATAEPPEPPTFAGRFDDQGLLVPCTGPQDWVHLTSSEWLHGDLREFKLTYLEFKSERLKEQRIKWKHVVELCTPFPTRFVDGSMKVITGAARLYDDIVYVWTLEGELVEIPREELFAILPGEPKELNRWRAMASLGATVYSGNTNQTSVTATVEFQRRAVGSLMSLGYDGAQGTANNVENVNRHRGDAYWQYDLTRSFYATVFDIDVLNDRFLNLDVRASPGVGAGYRIFDRGLFEWSAETGAIYQYTEFRSVGVGEPSSTSDGGVRFTTRMRWDVTGDLEFKGDHSTILVASDFRQTSYNTRLALIYDITDLLKLEFRLNHDRIREPRPRENGTVPAQDDLQTVLAFGIDLRP